MKKLNINPIAQNFINEFLEENKGARILFVYIAGSQFFDLHSPDSDEDYRLVYLPAPKHFMERDPVKRTKLLNQGKSYTTNDKDKNSNEDVDLAIYSLPKVLELLKSGDFNMMEMLFTPENKIIFDTPLMKEIRSNRDRLLVNDISSFIGFFKKEYKQYGININHHKYRVQFCELLKSLDQEKGKKRKLSQHWETLEAYQKENPQCFSFTETFTSKTKKHPTIVVGERKFQWGVTIKYVLTQLKPEIENAGNRQKAMAEHGKEFKGLYHAKRLVFEAKELALEGKLTIPFPKEQHEYLKAIKEGNVEEKELKDSLNQDLDYLKELELNTSSNKKTVGAYIDKVILSLNTKMELSSLHEKAKFSFMTRLKLKLRKFTNLFKEK